MANFRRYGAGAGRLDRTAGANREAAGSMKIDDEEKAGE
jgi:hypothetical protein